MANKRHIVELSGDERARLSAMITKGKCSAQANLKARILLKADQGPRSSCFKLEPLLRFQLKAQR